MRYQLMRRQRQSCVNKYDDEMTCILHCKHLMYDAYVVDTTRLGTGEEIIYRNWHEKLFYV